MLNNLKDFFKNIACFCGFLNKNTKRIYLDNAASTPVCKEVQKEMMSCLKNKHGNPGAIHSEGVVAKNTINNARKEVSSSISAHPDEIIFTGSGTESNNIAIIGIIKYYLKNKDNKHQPHIISSTIEHPSVHNTLQTLKSSGDISVTYINVDCDGVVDIKEFKDALRKETILVSIMHANNEIGTIQPIRELAKIVRDFKKKTKAKYPLLHTDACQSFGYLDVNTKKLGVDLMTFSASKIYGPKGIGALYIKRDIDVLPLFYGGTQEQGIRPGTENLVSIVGFAKAVSVNEKKKGSENKRLTLLRDELYGLFFDGISNVSINGTLKNRLPNNLNISIPDMDSTEIVLRLDAKGIACSTQSACKSNTGVSSSVVLALNSTKNKKVSSLRFSLGRNTTRSDIHKTAQAVFDVLKTMNT